MGERVCVIDAGVIQQVDDPIQLYKRPSNRFVAEFIGTPSMNFLDGHIRIEGGSVTFESQGNISWPIPATKQCALAECGGQPVTIGLRPEAIQVAVGDQWFDAPRMTAVVELIEHLGPESHIYLRAGTAPLVSRAGPRRDVHAFQTVEIAILVNQAHFFAHDTGLRVA